MQEEETNTAVIAEKPKSDTLLIVVLALLVLLNIALAYSLISQIFG